MADRAIPSTMPAMPSDDAVLCFRCHYDLRGITDEQPCPECGLLAGRSRRSTDALRDARPKWLRSLSCGICLILFGILLVGTWPIVSEMIAEDAEQYWEHHSISPWYVQIIVFHTKAFVAGGIALSAVMFFIGALMFTRHEGYEPADRMDRRRRIAIRVLAIIPLAGGTIVVVPLIMNAKLFSTNGWISDLLIPAVFTLGLAPLPWLGFRQFKNLARRSGSRHLSEHCSIVGVGTTATFVLAFGMYFFMNFARSWGIDENWMSHSTVPMLLMLVMGTAAMLFWLWCLYLMIRFAISFGRASRESRREWRAADRAQSTG